MAEKPPAQGQYLAMPPALGYQLGIARKQAGLTLRELARRLGVSPSLLSQIENGKSQPSVATLYALAQALQISIDNLFEIPDGDPEEVETHDAPSAEGDNVVSMSNVLHRPPAATDPPRRPEQTVTRSELGPLHKAWYGAGGADRLSVTTPSD